LVSTYFAARLLLVKIKGALKGGVRA
jgi:hypothetical protein